MTQRRCIQYLSDNVFGVQEQANSNGNEEGDGGVQ